MENTKKIHTYCLPMDLRRWMEHSSKTHFMKCPYGKKGSTTMYTLKINGLDHIILPSNTSRFYGQIFVSKFLICCNMDIFSQITYLTFWIVLSIEEFSVHPHHKDMSDRDSSVHLSRRPWFVSYAMYF